VLDPAVTRNVSDVVGLIERCLEQGDNESGLLLFDSRKRKAAGGLARTCRETVFFIWGLAPTIPVLVHLEVAAHRLDNDEKAVDEALDGWRKTITQWRVLVRQYREVAEVTKLRLDLLIAIGDSLKDLADSSTIAPDASYASLGVEGLALFAPQTPRAGAERLQPRSIFADIEEMLNSCLNYVDDFKKP
jgi:hypothetical protein